MMKVTKEQSAQNREALVRAASKLFREYGIDGVGVAEIAKEAELTHGALYAQFPSKEAIAAEALADALERTFTRLVSASGSAPTIGNYLDWYISKRHRDNVADGCAMAASGSEIGRHDKTVSRSFAQGFERTVRAIEAAMQEASLTATPRERALTIAVGAIGAIAVARGVAKANPRLSGEILAACRRVLGELGGERN
ncbi:MAG TPA: helix-turn-helix domain-containing protein [Candidatus Binatia bacterium]|nr:helix-turn-helix domain-containing protein [Candidatus Binatia bacterium]